MGSNALPNKDKFFKAMRTFDLTRNETKAANSVNVPRQTFQNWKRRRSYFESAFSGSIPIETTADLLEKMKIYLKGKNRTALELAEHLKIPADHIQSLAEQLRETGVNVSRVASIGGPDGGFFTVLDTPAPPAAGSHVYVSRKGGHYRFGYLSDNHYCSKYAREEVTNDLYDWFAASKVDRVFNTGNYIDGEARFNKHDIFVHGMQNQINYFCERYPKRSGITTYFVSGDDHEGWYGQREGIDVGWLTQKTAEDKYRRSDLVHLGFIESFVKLQHLDVPDAWNYLLAAHPGGGSAYAVSYSPQKYVEALQGGEKPAVILFGHWHKIFDLLIRGVICLGGGCTKDLDPFGRKNKLAYHIGGMVVDLWQDEQGAITRWRVEKKHYFDRGYHNSQWSYEGRGLITKEN